MIMTNLKGLITRSDLYYTAVPDKGTLHMDARLSGVLVGSL